MISIDDAKKAKIEAIYHGERAQELYAISEILHPHFPEMVDTFYTSLLTHPETQAILENKIVEKRLPAALLVWLQLIFPRQQGANTVDAIFDRHRELGQLHAKINVNLNYMLHGVSIIKDRIYAILKDHQECGDYSQLVSSLFDALTSIISEHYFSSEMEHESNELSMRVKGLTQNMAIECERMRSMLLDWLRETLNFIYQNACLDLDSLPKLKMANFGLWVIYKLDLITTDNSISQELRSRVDDIDHVLFLAAKGKCEGDEAVFLQHINELNDKVTSMSWYISSIVDQAIEIDTGLDPLTRVFNRRYLETVLRRQTNISLKQGLCYSVMLADIDHFKSINDNYGHAAGDLVLKHFAEVLLTSIRASDFLFRYGGEEFLILAGNLDLDSAYNLAEKLRKKVEVSKFAIESGKFLNVTCSIGVAQYKGHPNYNMIVDEADAALYKAKQDGRNKTVKSQGR